MLVLFCHCVAYLSKVLILISVLVVLTHISELEKTNESKRRAQ